MALAATMMRLEQTRPVGRPGGVSAPAASMRPRTTIVDVATLDMDHSRTGLYGLSGASVRPIDAGHPPKADKILARAKGLTPEQARDLQEQNVELVFVRECGCFPLCGVRTEGTVGDRNEIFGTAVIPYLALSPQQAESLMRIAASMPNQEQDSCRSRGSDDVSSKVVPFGLYGGGGC
ncbi:MAG: hypothetical protein ABII71_04265 [Candidatus Micrarchaeota archaeon]